MAGGVGHGRTSFIRYGALQCDTLSSEGSPHVLRPVFPAPRPVGKIPPERGVARRRPLRLLDRHQGDRSLSRRARRQAAGSHGGARRGGQGRLYLARGDGGMDGVVGNRGRVARAGTGCACTTPASFQKVRNAPARMSGSPNGCSRTTRASGTRRRLKGCASWSSPGRPSPLSTAWHMTASRCCASWMAARIAPGWRFEAGARVRALPARARRQGRLRAGRARRTLRVRALTPAREAGDGRPRALSPEPGRITGSRDKALGDNSPPACGRKNR